MIGLSHRQREVYDFIAARVRETGKAPTHPEIVRGLGFCSRGAVSNALKLLEQSEVVRRPGAPGRPIELCATIHGRRFRFLPKTSAGNPAGSAPAAATPPAAAGCLGPDLGVFAAGNACHHRRILGDD